MFPVLTYIAAIATAEMVGAFASVTLGILIHVALIILFLGQYLLKERAPYRRVLPVLLLAPLLRILSLVMPVQQIPQIYWYALVGVPLLVAAALTVRLLDLSRASLGLHIPSKPLQASIALSGLPLSAVAFLIFRPEPLLSGFTWLPVIISSAILAIFTGFAEEFVFRGLLQQVIDEAFGGRVAVLFSNILFTVMYIGSMSFSFIFFIGLVGLFFGYCAYKTRSIWGVAMAHSLLTIGMLVIWPSVMSALD